MFAVGVFVQGFHSDWGFWIAGGIGIIFSFIGLIFGLDWDDDRIDFFFQQLLRRKPKSDKK